MKLSKKAKNSIEQPELDLDALLQPKPQYIEATYAALTGNRCIFISEDFTKELAAVVSATLISFNNEDNKTPITIYINSNGGDGSALIHIYDVINSIKAPVETVCMSKCYSAGAFLLAAGQKGRRFIFKHAQVMIHGLQCHFPGFSEDQVETKTYYSFLDSFNDSMMKILAKHTGQSIKKIKEDCKKDLYLDPQEAIEYGLVDHILE